MKSTSQLEIQGVCKCYPAGDNGEIVEALKDINFSVEKGEFVCLLGRSGCGKSTLLSIIAGLQKPSCGSALLDGRPIEGPDRHRMLMLQDPALFPWLDVMENVLYGLKLVDGLSAIARRERAEHYLDLVGLSRFQNFRIHDLSGGMRQRVALARALAPNPEILLMDEPFSALDAMTREQLYADMQAVWENTQKTVVMVTHNTREASCLASRIILMRCGTVMGDVPITLAYPRTMNDLNITKTAAHIAGMLQDKQPLRERIL